MSNLQLHLIWAAGVALLLGLGALYERHQGAVGCLAADQKASSTQNEKTARAEGAGAVTVQNEGETHARATLQPLAPTPTVRLRPFTLGACKALPPSAPGPQRDGAPDLRAADAPSGLQGDWNALIRSDVQTAHNADAQVIELQDYVLKVCPPPT